MITLIIKSYFAILLGVGIGALSILCVGLYCLLRRFSSSISPSLPQTIERIEEVRDVTAIAGDDIIATQLDLARAFVETGRKQAAKSILETVAIEGDTAQQEEAQALLNYL